MQIALLFVALIVLGLLAVKGVPIFITTLGTALVFGLTQGLKLSDTMSLFSAGAGKFVGGYILMFALGGIFGKLIEMSGAADKIATVVVNRFGERYVVWGIGVATAILVYGGVSVFVAMYPIYTISISMFKRANISRINFLTAYSAGAGWVCVMPGSPSVTNVIPARILGTDLASCAIPGIIDCVILFLVVMLYCDLVYKKKKAQGEGFEMPAGQIYEIKEDCPPFALSVFPMIFLLVVLNGLKVSIELTLLYTNILCVVIFWKWLCKNSLRDTFVQLKTAITVSFGSLTNTAVTIGFGSVISGSAGFALLAEKIRSLTSVPPIIGLVLMTTIMVAAAGSQSGGLGIVTPILKEVYIPMGLSPELIHRMSVFVSNGLDTLPHNGWVVTTLGMSGYSYKEGYIHIAVITILCTFFVNIGGGLLIFKLFGLY